MNRTLSQILLEMNKLPSFLEVNLTDPNTKGDHGEYPLHVAVVQNDIEAVKTLISAGANINAQGEYGYTPLHEAIEQELPEIVALLLANGAKTDIENDLELCAKEFAALNSNTEIMSLFE